MKISSLAAALTAALVLAAPAGAAPRTLTLDEAVETAVRNNLTLERASWDLAAKERQTEKAWNVFLPSVQTAATWSASPDTVNSVTGADVTGLTNLVGTAKLSLTLPGNVFVSLEAAALNYRSGLLGYDLARRSVEKSVRLAHTNLLLAQENLRVTKESMTRAEQNLAKVQANYKAGLVPDLDVLSAQVNLASLGPQYRQLEASYQNSLDQFKFVLGLDPDDEVTLAGDLNTEVEKRVNLAGLDRAQTSPDVQRAQLAVDSASLSRRSQQLASSLPALSLGWSYSPTMVDLFDANFPQASARPDKVWQDNGSFTVTLSYSLDSLIPWSGSRETLLQADDGVKKAESQLKETRLASELNRRNYIRSIGQAVDTLASLELNAELAKKTYDLTLAAYQKGARDLLAVQGAEGDLDSARYRILAQRATLLSTILSLEDELGVPFGTILQEKK